MYKQKEPHGNKVKYAYLCRVLRHFCDENSLPLVFRGKMTELSCCMQLLSMRTCNMWSAEILSTSASVAIYITSVIQ